MSVPKFAGLLRCWDPSFRFFQVSIVQHLLSFKSLCSWKMWKMEIQVLHQEGPMAGSIWAGSKGTWIVGGTFRSFRLPNRPNLGCGRRPGERQLKLILQILNWLGHVCWLDLKSTHFLVAVLRVQNAPKHPANSVDLAAFLVQHEGTCRTCLAPKNRTWLWGLFHVCSQHIAARAWTSGFAASTIAWFAASSRWGWFLDVFHLWMDKLLRFWEKKLRIVGTLTRYINWFIGFCLSIWFIIIYDQPKAQSYDQFFQSLLRTWSWFTSTRLVTELGRMSKSEVETTIDFDCKNIAINKLLRMHWVYVYVYLVILE